jgi:hypothetical protein
MHWLADLLIELITLFVPWNSKHADRSKVGESPMDRNARQIGIALLVILALLAGGWLYLRP